MKKSKILWTLLTGALALLLASCSDLNSDASMSNSYTQKSAGDTKELTLNVTSNDKLLIFPTAKEDGARTILPAAIDAGSSDVKFYLSTWDTLDATKTNYTFDPTPVNFVATKESDGATTPTTNPSHTKGTIQKTLEVSTYKFILYCVPSSVTQPTSDTLAASNAMFIGYATADLRYADQITFYMTADKATGNGYVDLTLYSSNKKSTEEDDLWNVPEDYKVTAGIYSKIDDTIVTGTSVDILEVAAGGTPEPINAAKYGGGSGSSVVTLPAGSYNFVVTFTTPASGTTNQKKYYYSDEIIVLPNQTTTQNVFIPKVIEQPPEAPSSFFAVYADPKSKEDNYYYAQFVWSDNSNNEKSFEIDLVKVDDNVTNFSSSTPTYKIDELPKSDDDWSTGWIKDYTNPTDGNITTYKWDTYQTSQYNPDPSVYSLVKNNTRAVFMLPLGSRYAARIRAYNEQGYSDYAYLNIASKTSDSTAAALKWANTANDSTTYATPNTGFNGWKTYVPVTGMGNTLQSTSTDAVACDATGSDLSVITFTEKFVPKYDPTLLTETGDPGKTYLLKTAYVNVTQTLAGAGTNKWTAFDFGTYTVNRYRITYQLAGGDFKGDAATAHATGYDEWYSETGAPKKPATVLYKSQTATKSGTTFTPNGIEILNPDGDKKEGSAFTDVDGTTVAADTSKPVNLVYTNNDINQKFNRWLLYSTDDSGKYPTAGNRYPVSFWVWNDTGLAYEDKSSDYSSDSEIAAANANPAIRKVPKPYTGHNNLTLFASYAIDSTLNVKQADYTAFEWLGYGETYITGPVNATTPTTATDKSDVSITGKDSASTPNTVYFTAYLHSDGTTPDPSDGGSDKKYAEKGQFLQVSATASPTITFTLNTTTKHYDKVTLRARRTNSKAGDYKYDKAWALDGTAKYTDAVYELTGNYGAWNKSPASWDVGVKGWKTGKYQFFLIGESNQYPNKKYTFPITIDLVD